MKTKVWKYYTSKFNVSWFMKAMSATYSRPNQLKRHEQKRVSEYKRGEGVLISFLSLAKCIFTLSLINTKQCLIHLESKTLNRFISRSMNITCTHLKWDACNLFMCFCSEIEYSNVWRRRDGSKGNGVTEYQSSPQEITLTKLQIFLCYVCLQLLSLVRWFWKAI